MATSCPNCGVPCVGCAGATLIKASDGKQCCTKCVAAYNSSKNPGKPSVPYPRIPVPVRGPYTPHT